MYLKRVTITGFKSFASKTVIEFERGISAVVGPNGSGKSNVADAIRWCLGEQSKAKLRTSDREEVIFAGTEGRARASFCEVVLVFDNESGRFGVDLTEVEFARRLYRSGESDYRLAGQTITLREAQALMAEAGFGAGTYAVIGQGMIDSLLLASPAERKALFDEAAGIRGPELRREAALRQLAAARDNVGRLRDIAGELEPRLRTLERAVAADARAERLRQQVAAVRLAYAAQAHYELARDQTAVSDRRQTLALNLHALRHERQRAEAALRACLRQAEVATSRRDRDLQTLTQLERERDRLSSELAISQSVRASRVAAADEAKAVRALLESDQLRLERTRDRRAALTRKLDRNAEAAIRAAATVRAADELVVAAQAALVELRDSLSDEAVLQYVDHALRLVKTMAVSIDDGSDAQALRLLVHKAGRLLSHASRSGAAEVVARIGAAQAALEAAMAKRDTAIAHQTNITILGRSLELDARQDDSEIVRFEAAIDERAATIERLTAQADNSEADDGHIRVAFDAATQRLADVRRRLSAPAVDAGAAAQAAASLERLGARQADDWRALADLGERTYQLDGLHQALAKQAEEWHIAVPVASNQAVVADTLETLERKLIKLEAELAAHDHQSAADREEYEAVKVRFQTMTEQIIDLESAETDLGVVVDRLDALIRERFHENFARLSDEFGRCYAELFEGGTARLELVEDADRSYGVNILINPKGRRFMGLTALSGGERALAGVALLAGILHTSPAPFVVLDEVDAALDEANSGRLATSLARLNQHSQLIVITHNRQTMAAAGVLYGVTMDGRQTSQVLSLKLDEAAEMAAR